MPRHLRNRLEETESFLRLFLLVVPTRILYIEYDTNGQPTFCAASSRVPQLLRSALWNTREPAILTSGTLVAAGDFSHTEQRLGLATYKPLRHFQVDSPFDYQKNCLLYFPTRRAGNVPENLYLADQISLLTAACYGHALVLFTSYRQMRHVYDALGGSLAFPVFQAGRGQNRCIQQFKESSNGVLFAAGACWEGIDFPGDMVSLLIIAKLPFPIPDPVSDYERQQYPNLRDYIQAEIIPEMQKKLRQGFGRAIRTESDSCVVAILDERAGVGGKYHNDDLIRKNPFDFQLATVIVNDSVTRKAITRKQERAFLEFVKNDKYYCKYYEGIYILFKTGLRISEFVGLTVNDIDLQNRKLTISHQLQRTRKMDYIIENPKTECGVRTIPLSDDVYECFVKIIHQRPKLEREPNIGEYCGFLYLDKNGKPMVAMHWEHFFKHIWQKYNSIYREQLPLITPHVCRHTYCSNMAKSGMNPKTLQYLMGHSDIGVTLNTYTHLGYEDAKDELQRLVKAG